MSELTTKQKAFIEEIPKNQWNGTKAAIAAGYSPKSAGVMACRLLKNPKIAAELERRTAEISEKTDVEVAEIVAALCKFAFGGKKATNTEILKALELLGRYKSMFTDKLLTEQHGLTLVEIMAIVGKKSQILPDNKSAVPVLEVPAVSEGIDNLKEPTNE